MKTARFHKRIAAIEQYAQSKWARPDLSHLHWDVLTVEEEALVLVLNDRVGEVGTEGLTPAELEQIACLHDRLHGTREHPCAKSSLYRDGGTPGRQDV
jgi:hypothetical protein